MRKRRGERVNGWLILDKPSGVTSAEAVAKVRRLLNAQKAGHGGTLDPLATGILPIALGEATKTVSYVMDGAKVYRFTVRWGERTETDDAEGKVTATSEYRPSREQIDAVLPIFSGEIEQTPPAYSAIKVGGQRAYALARAKEVVPLSPRSITINSIALIDLPDADHAVFEVRSGKGAYMRALARDIAGALNTFGHVADLRRLSVGCFTEAQAIPLDNALSLGHSARLAEHLLSVDAALDDIPALDLTEAEARRLQHGQAIAVLPVASRSSLKSITKDSVFRAMAMGRPVALATIKGGEIRPLRVLNL